MPVKRRQNLAETRASYYKEERLEEFLDSKSAFCNEQQQGFVNSYYRIVSPILLEKLRFCHLQAPEAL